MKNFFFILGVGLFLAACNDNEFQTVKQEGITFTVPDFVDESGTRVGVSIDDSGANFTWTDGDTLGVFPENGYQTAFPISGGAGTNTAVFDGADWALRSNASYAAYYPMQHPMDAIDKTAIEVSYLGQTQNGNGSTAHLGAYDYLASAYNTVSSSGDVNFTLNHLGCLVRFQLTMPEADTYTKMTISCDDATFVTDAKFNLTAATPALTAKSLSSSITLGLTNVETTSANEVLTLYMMLPPMDWSGKEFGITVSGGNLYKTTVTGKCMSKGCIYGYSNTLTAAHKYVDLGLSVMWATCNIGANSPEEYGDYFAWGEVNGTNDGKTSFLVDTYKYYEGYNNLCDIMNKYCTNSKYGTVDGLETLEHEDDVANNKWGGSWYMPTSSNFEELRSNCTWSWCTLSNTNGYKIVGPNGNWIFLPAAGSFGGSTNDNGNQIGEYWSRTLCSSQSDRACSISYTEESVSIGDCFRYFGLSVRPVFAPTRVTSISLSEKSLNLKDNGTSATLTVTVLPNDATNSSVSWLSSNTDVAVVNQSGLVTIIDNGTSYIIATTTDGSNLSDTCVINVGNYNNGHEYIDLGLPSGTLWANFVIGANSLEESGSRFAWGETVSKTEFSWSNYKYCRGTNTSMTKYCDYQDYGTIDGLSTLELSDDAAHVLWGGPWVVPSQEDFLELLKKCELSVITKYNYNYVKVTGPNGNYLLLKKGVDAACWTNFNGDCISNSALLWYASISTSTGVADYAYYSINRYNGRYIRPVIHK